MLSGEKPLAVFSDIIESSYVFPDDEFEPHVLSGQIIKRDYRYDIEIRGNKYVLRYLYFALPDEEWRIDAAHNIDLIVKNGAPETDEMTADRGRLLGYSEEDISVFLEWFEYQRRLVFEGSQ